MISLKINNSLVEVEENTPLYIAARKAGFEVPVMCVDEGMTHFTSCMVCGQRQKDWKAHSFLLYECIA